MQIIKRLLTENGLEPKEKKEKRRKSKQSEYQTSQNWALLAKVVLKELVPFSQAEFVFLFFFFFFCSLFFMQL
jgi:hypothetical protein